MAEPHCRIGRVRYKHPAQILRLVPKGGADQSSAGVIAHLRDAVEHFSGIYADDAAGYALVIWGRDGHLNGIQASNRSSPFGVRAVPAVVHDILAEDAIERVVIDTFNRK